MWAIAALSRRHLDLISPPGVNDLVPELGLAYSSDASVHSVVGAGFSLVGLDCIAREGPTLPLANGTRFGDGVPKFTSNDNFYYSGERLIGCDEQPGGATATCLSGTFVPGRHNFEKIESQTPDVPQGWKVTQRDGTIFRYAQGVVRQGNIPFGSSNFDNSARILSLEVEQFGNKISYHDSPDGNYPYLDRIEYGYPPGYTTGRRVELLWEDRPDKWEDFSDGLALGRWSRHYYQQNIEERIN